MESDGKWDFWIDRGGTFTDVVARDPNGQIHVHKLLSEDPEHYEDAPLEGIRRLLGVEPDGAIPCRRQAIETTFFIFSKLRNESCIGVL